MQYSALFDELSEAAVASQWRDTASRDRGARWCEYFSDFRGHPSVILDHDVVIKRGVDLCRMMEEPIISDRNGIGARIALVDEVVEILEAPVAIGDVLLCYDPSQEEEVIEAVLHGLKYGTIEIAE